MGQNPPLQLRNAGPIPLSLPLLLDTVLSPTSEHNYALPHGNIPAILAPNL